MTTPDSRPRAWYRSAHWIRFADGTVVGPGQCIELPIATAPPGMVRLAGKPADEHRAPLHQSMPTPAPPMQTNARRDYDPLTRSHS